MLSRTSYGKHWVVLAQGQQRDEIRDILSVAYETNPMVRNFGVAVVYELTYVYPHERNEAAIGLDYQDLKNQWPDVEQAITERREKSSRRSDDPPLASE